MWLAHIKTIAKFHLTVYVTNKNDTFTFMMVEFLPLDAVFDISHP